MPYVEEDALGRRLAMARQGVTTAAEDQRWIAGLSRCPELVGSTSAAAMLGVPAPAIAKLRAAGRMPGGVPVEGGYDVYFRSDVEELARELAGERAERARRRKEPT